MSFWKDARVLVTAGNGFTGSHLCRELLNSGAHVRTIVKPSSVLSNLSDISENIEICPGDITDFDSLMQNMKGIDYVFNPAAIVPVNLARQFPQKTFTVNGIGAFNVGYAAMKNKVKKMLHVSSCHIYGNVSENELPLKESVTPIVGDLYAASKYAAEIYLRALINEGFPIVFSRGFAIFGPGQGPQFLIPRIITQILRGEPLRLGNSLPTRDYSYIVNIVRGLMVVLEKGSSGEVYHLSSQTERSVGQVCDSIIQALNVKVKPEWNLTENRPLDIMRLFGDSSKIRSLGWEPTISFEDGLDRTVAWWKKELSVAI